MLLASGCAGGLQPPAEKSGRGVGRPAFNTAAAGLNFGVAVTTSSFAQPSTSRHVSPAVTPSCTLSELGVKYIVRKDHGVSIVAIFYRLSLDAGVNF